MAPNPTSRLYFPVRSLGDGQSDVLPTFYQGEKVSSRRPFQRGSRETEGMLHAE